MFETKVFGVTTELSTSKDACIAAAKSSSVNRKFIQVFEYSIDGSKRQISF